MTFENEHLLPGQIGHFFVLLSFITSIVAAIAYFTASKIDLENEKEPWLKIGRGAFFLQFLSILVVFGCIYHINSNHYFEYVYAYKHSSLELEPKFLLAGIWEGQEGSFLLWSVWHCILGVGVILTAKKREAPVMAIVNTAQFFLTIMLLGIYVFGEKIGSNPFALTRNELEGPIFAQANYLSYIKDGIGLNVLLRNYWMVIHPPILFLGFASTLIPVGFAFSSLISKDWGGWIKPVLPWTLLSCLTLGVGIMMGGKWAYESLSFGGYWAWDPVENASLVPWLILVSALHCMAIFKATGNALRATYFFTILSYFFILYSTFLTRTGILGDTSVHSFTEAGMIVNILISMYVLGITLPMFFLYFKNFRSIPSIQREENISSREFWMFIGSLILFLSAIFIIAVTSLPVYNKLLGTNLADPQDREFTYNKVMVLVAVILGLITGFGQYLKYRNTGTKYLISKLAWPLGISIVLSVVLAIVYPIEYTTKGPGFLGAIYAALFACIFSVIANAAYLKTVLKGNLKAGGGAIAHLGFTMMIAGMLISSGNKEVISDNRATGLYIPFEKDPTGRFTENPMENLTLLKGVPTQMGRYTVTYLDDVESPMEKTRTYYHLHFQRKDKDGNVDEDFMLTPDSYRMKDNNLSSNPDTRHYLTHDVFTYVSTISIKNEEKDTTAFKINEMAIGDSGYYAKGYFVLNDIVKNPTNSRFNFSPSDTALMADITVYSNDSTSYKAYPALTISNQEINFLDDTVVTQNIHLNLGGVTTDKKFKIGIKESNKLTDFITVKSYIFPNINLVWAGLIIMACGFAVSMVRRAKASKLISYIVIGFVLISLIYMFLFANT
ncbi:MAG: cytochrome c biogenesis protein CcsA [Ginsengibacter sp.]